MARSHPRPSSWPRGLVALLWCALATLPTHSSDSADVLVQAIRTARLEPDRAVQIDSLEIDLGFARMQFEEGHFVPAAPIDGRTFELAFVGHARFFLDPPDSIEAGQLELFTGRQRLEVEVRQAVLLIADDAVVRRVLDRPTGDPADATRVAEISAVFDEWVEGAERRGFGAEGAIFKASLGDARAQGHFAVWVRTEELGDFYYLLDPFEIEQITLGQFVEADLDEIDRHQIEREIRRQRRKGRLTQLRVADLGDWDTWVSTAPRDGAGSWLPGSQGFEATHYALDVEVGLGETAIEARATIDLRSTSAGRRVVSMTLYRDLAVRSVRDGAGEELEWFRVDEDLHVVLATPVEAGEPLRLDIDFGGELLTELAGGIYAMNDTFGWYPRVGTVDRATYEVVLRWPAKRELLASGRIVEEGRDGDQRWQRRTLDEPSFAFSFEYGDYDIHTVRVGHVDLTVGFSKMPSNWERGAKEEVIATLSDALQFLEEKFGAYPLDYLTVATVPRGFSQGFLSFVTLAHTLIAVPKGRYFVIRDEDFDTIKREYRDETIAHELAHQWWGHKVGWVDYRDQWLSEALADFSATLYEAQATKQSTVYLARHAMGWKRAVNTRTEDGRTVESLGPVVLGTRLASSISNSAYTAVVYDKGSVVFSMLARGLQIEPFTKMLGALADAAAHRNIDTATFIKAIERMSGVDLAEFAELFVYGTGIPEVYYRYRIRPAEEGWIVEGTARLVATGHDTYRVVHDDGDRWRIERSRAPGIDISKHFLVAPFQIAVTAAPQGTEADPENSRHRIERGYGGQLLLDGETTEFSIPVPEEPRLMWFDQRGEVLAEFFAENHQPKRTLRYQAMELPPEEAEETYRQALAAPLYSEAGMNEVELSEKTIERQTRLEDAVILYRLAQLYLDQGRDDEAYRAFEQAKDKIPSLDRNFYKRTRNLIDSRIAVREGRYKEAYGQLSSSLALDFDRTSESTIFDSARRKKFRSGRRAWMGGNAYALLAIAAWETDHREIAERAVEEAEERGADMSALRVVMQP